MFCNPSFNNALTEFLLKPDMSLVIQIWLSFQRFVEKKCSTAQQCDRWVLERKLFWTTERRNGATEAEDVASGNNPNPARLRTSWKEDSNGMHWNPHWGDVVLHCLRDNADTRHKNETCRTYEERREQFLLLCLCILVKSDETIWQTRTVCHRRWTFLAQWLLWNSSLKQNQNKNYVDRCMMFNK